MTECMDYLPNEPSGAVLGLAMGDALGAPFEFRRAAQHLLRPSARVRARMDGAASGHHDGRYGHGSEPVSYSFIGCLALDTDDVLARHIAWLRTRPLDVGNLTRIVLSRAAEGAAHAAREYVEERGPEVSAGNGSVMYCAPLGVAYAFRPDECSRLAPALSVVTHWDERRRTACLAVTLAVAALVRGEPGDRAVVAAVTAVADREGGEELEYLVEAAGHARPVGRSRHGIHVVHGGSRVAGGGREPSSVRARAPVRGRSRRRHRRCAQAHHVTQSFLEAPPLAHHLQRQPRGEQREAHVGAVQRAGPAGLLHQELQLLASFALGDVRDGVDDRARVDLAPHERGGGARHGEARGATPGSQCVRADNAGASSSRSVRAWRRSPPPTARST